MLVSTRMASIPCSPRHSISNMKDLQDVSQNSLASITPRLQYFNMRVTERLHRYRSLKRQWHEVATAVQNEPSLSPKPSSPLPIPDIQSLTLEQTVGRKSSDVKDYFTPTIITTTTMKEHSEKTSNEIDPLHSRIQQDLIKLRKLIKARRKKLTENLSSKSNINRKSPGETPAINATDDDQDNHHTITIRKSSSLNRPKPLDRVKISGCQMRPSTFPQSTSTDNRILTKSNSTSTCSQYPKQQKTTKTFNIYRSRVNPPLPTDSLIHGTPLPKQKINSIPHTTTLKQTRSLHLPISSLLKKKQSSFTQHEPLLPPIRRSLNIEQPTTCLYTYAASTSSATPRSMKLHRNKSILPILLTSSSCIGIQSQKFPNDNNNNLPKPIIPIFAHHDQDDYGILLDHIRQTMPNSTVYNSYTRIC